jgi:hypothetical protein
MANEFDRFKGLPDIVTHPTVTGAEYAGLIRKPKIETEEERMIRTRKMAGIKQVGVPEKITPEIAKETKPVSPVAGIPAETKQVETKPAEVSLPYGYPEGEKVYTETELPTQRELAGGGFGFVPRGLPEAGTDIKAFYAESMQKLTDRASHVADTIEAGFFEGRRLTAAVEELKALHQGINDLGTQYTAMEAGTTESAYKKALAGKAERETLGMPETYEEAVKGEERVKAAGVKESKGLFEFGYQEYTKTKNKILASTDYLSEEDRQRDLAALDAQYPQYASGGNISSGITTGTRGKSKSGKPIIYTGKGSTGWEYE